MKTALGISILFSLFAFVRGAFSAEIPTAGMPGVELKLAPCPHQDRSDLATWDRLMAQSPETRGLTALGRSETTGEHIGVFDLDEAYLSEDGARGVLIRSHVEWESRQVQSEDLKQLDGRVFEVSDGDHLYVGKRRDGVRVAAYFFGISPGTVRSLVEGQAQGSPFEVKNFSLISEAMAAEKSFCETSVKRGRKLASQSGQSIEEDDCERFAGKMPIVRGTAFAKWMTCCLKGVGGGLYNATIGLLVEAGKFVVRIAKGVPWFIQHPFSAIKQGLKNLIGFPKNVWKSFGKKKDSLAKVPGHQQARFWCRLAAQIGTGVFIGLAAQGSVSAGSQLLSEAEKFCQLHQTASDMVSMCSVVMDGNIGSSWRKGDSSQAAEQPDWKQNARGVRRPRSKQSPPPASLQQEQQRRLRGQK